MLCTENIVRVCAIAVAVILQGHVEVCMAIFDTMFRFSVLFANHHSRFISCNLTPPSYSYLMAQSNILAILLFVIRGSKLRRGEINS
jgi:hypothetical protein